MILLSGFLEHQGTKVNHVLSDETKLAGPVRDCRNFHDMPPAKQPQAAQGGGESRGEPPTGINPPQFRPVDKALM